MASLQERVQKLEHLLKCLCANPSGDGSGPQGPPGATGQGFTYIGVWSNLQTLYFLM